MCPLHLFRNVSLKKKSRTPVIPALRRLERKDPKLEASLASRVRLCLKQTQTNK
jgi:hypothetical protein